MENTVFYCYGGVFTVPLPRNRRPNFACACVDGICLPTRCLAMGIHVIISLDWNCTLLAIHPSYSYYFYLWFILRRNR
jgi:hypothetical protein